MTNADPLPAAVLSRKAVVYVRQSTQTQVQVHRESQRRQYDLVEDARRRGFSDVEVIDDDLGRSASGTVARPGFERLVASLCAGEVGAVLCFDASRLSRNGRDWHHLLELCGLVGARVIDPDGVYDPCRPNDRLLLGMKGSISEFELGILRSRMLDAARSKARRGELRIPVPIGYVWHREIGLGLCLPRNSCAPSRPWRSRLRNWRNKGRWSARPNTAALLNSSSSRRATTHLLPNAATPPAIRTTG